MAQKRTFWVLSKEAKEVRDFGPIKIPARFKTIEEAKQCCRDLNFRKGIYHPGYFVEERIGDQPVKAQPSKKTGPASEDSD